MMFCISSFGTEEMAHMEMIAAIAIPLQGTKNGPNPCKNGV